MNELESLLLVRKEVIQALISEDSFLEGLKPKLFFKKYQLGCDGCWLWTGAQAKGRGYGIYGWRYINKFGINKTKSKAAHIICYTMFKSFVPKGYGVDHTCRNALCGNPDHLAGS